MWLCLKLYLYTWCVVIFLLLKEGLLNVAVLKIVFI